MFGNSQTRLRARQPLGKTRVTAKRTTRTVDENSENQPGVPAKVVKTTTTISTRAKRTTKVLSDLSNIQNANNKVQKQGRKTLVKTTKLESQRVAAATQALTDEKKDSLIENAQKGAKAVEKVIADTTQIAKRVTRSAAIKKDAKPRQEEEECLPIAKKSRVIAQEPLADPVSKNEEWDDLDKEDEFDPLMVSEYVNEIFEYMKQLEIETKPNPDYMTQIQKELKWKMRVILIDWLIEVHAKFRLCPETLFLAVNIIDRFLSMRTVSLPKLQLVGITAMFIASKYEEVTHPSMNNFNYVADGGYTEEEIMKAERYILQVLNFSLQYPNPMNFLRRNSKAENYDVQTRTLAKYLMEITLLDNRFLHYVPSQIAAAALMLSRKMLKRGGWTPNLKHYSSYAEHEIAPISDLILDCLSKPTKQEALFKKYSTKKFMKASIFVRDWIKEQQEINEKQQARAERRTSRRLEDLRHKQEEENKEN